MKGVVVALFSIILIACEKKEFERLENIDIGHVDIVAHRGVTYQSAENGLRALSQSVDLGLNGVEFDIQMTKDSQIVVFHDADLFDRTGVHGGIPNFTLKELQELRLIDKSGTVTDEKIPTLCEVMKQIGSKIHCFIELKPIPTFSGLFFGKELIRVLNECNVNSSKVTIISFDIHQLALMYSLDESLPLCLIMYEKANLVDIEHLNPNTISYGPNKNYFYRLRGLILHANLCRKDILMNIRERANVKNIYIYDVKSLNNISKDNFQWIDGIITDYPKENMLIKAECR